MPGRAANEQNASVDDFIDRWRACEGGQERANYALFLTELCKIIGVAPPNPANADPHLNDYVFERVVKDPHFREGSTSTRRIDLYKRGSFVLEAKQSRLKGGSKDMGELPSGQVDGDGKHKWDVLMMNARRQAESYARALPTDHGWPPFILVCDVGNCIETYADFSGQGKNYTQYPDRKSCQISLHDLADEKIRNRLRQIWEQPLELDPTRNSTTVTKQIAERLADVSKSIEKLGYAKQRVASFLSRCILTMFAEDIGLLPKRCFKDLLHECRQKPENFKPLVEQLWEAMDKGEYAFAIKEKVSRFNGEFFKDREALPLGQEEIGELESAAACNWREVEPSIFGTFLEQALEAEERRRLGAHYTPKAYVERLVNATIMEPLREEWATALATAERQKSEGRVKQAAATLRHYHTGLCGLRILDPACGTGNFLYVAMEMIKRLEGEVADAITNVTGQDYIPSLQSHTVDPKQFIGMEINERAAAIAELVLWIGYLQWHFRTTSGFPSEPILQAFHNVQLCDAVLDRPTWPEADYIVGNPPFIGGKDIRARQGDAYVTELWKSHKDMNDSADYVMYWWDMAAELLTRNKTKLKRFGFVTTNSITQPFQRRVIERHLHGNKPISLTMAIPDHPWTKTGKDAAAVRIGMTVAKAGQGPGRLLEVANEKGLDSDAPRIEFAETTGLINADLSIGINVSSAVPLLANAGVCSRGVSLHGSGFIVTQQQAEYLGLGKRPGLEKHIRPYRNGKDLSSKARNVLVIDLLGLSVEDVRGRYPEVYQHLAVNVKPERDVNNRETYKKNWWLFGEPRKELRPALEGLSRYIATAQTAKHRVLTFLDITILPDNAVIAIASDDAYHLGVLSSRIHVCWSLCTGGWLGIGNDSRYLNSKCFDTFPFPVASADKAQAIADAAEQLDSLRKDRLKLHPELTLTALYNVLGRYRLSHDYSSMIAKDKAVFDHGLVYRMAELHDELDKAVFDAYGWPDAISDQDITNRLLALNFRRKEQESVGTVLWVRPEYQEPRFSKDTQHGMDVVSVATKGTIAKHAFPLGDDMKQTAEVMAILANATSELDVSEIASHFKNGKAALPRIKQVVSALRTMGFVVQDKSTKKYLMPRRLAS
jgi:hypothetical protein